MATVPPATPVHGYPVPGIMNCDQQLNVRQLACGNDLQAFPFLPSQQMYEVYSQAETYDPRNIWSGVSSAATGFDVVPGTFRAGEIHSEQSRRSTSLDSEGMHSSTSNTPNSGTSLEDKAYLAVPQNLKYPIPKPKRICRKTRVQGELKASNLQDQPTSGEQKQIQKRAHAQVERRYRDNMNFLIASLQSALEEVQTESQAGGDDPAPKNLPKAHQKRTSAARTRKGDTLLNAIKYIYQIRADTRRLNAELDQLRFEHALYEQ